MEWVGKEFDANSILEFEGIYINGEKNGKVKGYLKGKLVFEGEYKNGKLNGHGEEYNNKDKLIFKGEYINGKKMA